MRKALRVLLLAGVAATASVLPLAPGRVAHASSGTDLALSALANIVHAVKPCMNDYGSLVTDVNAKASLSHVKADATATYADCTAAVAALNKVRVSAAATDASVLKSFVATEISLRSGQGKVAKGFLDYIGGNKHALDSLDRILKRIDADYQAQSTLLKQLKTDLHLRATLTLS